MGWLQYSRPLWLSIGNHYILYLKAITAQMPIYRTGFPQRPRGRIFIDLARFAFQGMRPLVKEVRMRIVVRDMNLFPACENVSLTESCRALLGHPDEGVRAYVSIAKSCGALLRLDWRDARPPRARIRAFPQLGRSRGTGGDATLGSRQCHSAPEWRGPPFVSRTHGHVNVFKNQPWRDASSTVG
jgi:hypothetical protein